MQKNLVQQIFIIGYFKMNLNLNESQTSEFKQIWKDEYLKTICAFANTDGGKLYIGIDDDGKDRKSVV